MNWRRGRYWWTRDGRPPPLRPDERDDEHGYRNAEEDWDEARETQYTVRWTAAAAVFVALALFLWSDAHSQPVVGFLGDARTRESWCIGVASYADGGAAVGQHVDAQTCLGPGGMFGVDADHTNTHIRHWTRDGRALCLTDDRGDGADWVTLERCQQAQTNQKWTEVTRAGGDSNDVVRYQATQGFGSPDAQVPSYWVSVGAHLVGDPKRCLAVHPQHRYAGLRTFDVRLVMEPCFAGTIADRERRQIAFTPIVFDPSRATRAAGTGPSANSSPYYCPHPATGAMTLVHSRSSASVGAVTAIVVDSPAIAGTRSTTAVARLATTVRIQRDL